MNKNIIMNKNVSYKWVSLVFSVITICFLAVFYSFAWENPSGPPPSGTFYAPINEGPSSQAKSGALAVNNSFVAGAIGIGGAVPNVAGGEDLRADGDICTNAGGGKCLSSAGRYVPTSVKTTTATHNARFADSGVGFDEIQAWIESNGCSGGYHVCTAEDVMGYMTFMGTELPTGWIQDVSSLEWHRSGSWAGNCRSWTSNAVFSDEAPRGVIWSSTSHVVDWASCHQNLHVLCCK
ncbi:MAG: hypothetical protein A2365_03275 [Candidatus Nealsonbacteria bacterium RIFOXYB1_FULL_40_15]|uniref:Uncharacterized protein n=2 Tax=Candidatus Nealsoniibacteriota TaxID=1817911 RepID=A0A1G2ESP1_9BACT|nr:MAG: hypothetical protein A2365_03275 [Candidatus Nealsonbacteria bacterium RIFOXYB1_FULL_40_15]OGZ28835.1 MAG: hypothetical protein A2427_00230 [Candidatus Nealsonbacteria bacterium RIFOXYC1_FULL_40_7]OGZ29391.1 MAG: hypothetical protein A2562_04765 [Candidatus Nealsonbacteria bacterium RIFOXYD1_FULL_39_11]